MELSDEAKKRILEEERQRIAEEQYREQVRSELRNARGLSEMPFTWECTTIPAMPFSLPIGVALNVTADSIQVHAQRKGTLGELMGLGTDVDESIAFQKHEIIGIEMFLM